MRKMASTQANDSASSGHVVRALKDDLRRILPLWGALVMVSLLAVALLRLYSIPLISHIEYKTANPYTLALIYAEEGKKYYAKCLKKIEQQKREGRSQPLLRDDADLARAKRVLLHSLSLYPDSPDVYEYLASLAAFEGNQADVHYYQGLLSAAKGVTTRALAELDAALATDPNKTEAALKKSEILITTNRLDEAEELLRALVAADKNGQAHYLLARIEALRGNPHKAITLLQQSLQRDATNVAAAKMLADHLFAANNKEEALKVLVDAERAAPNDANLKHRVGIMLYEMQRYGEAARVMEQAAEIERFSAPLYLDLARTYRRLGKQRLAAITLEKALRLDPSAAADKMLEE